MFIKHKRKLVLSVLFTLLISGSILAQPKAAVNHYNQGVDYRKQLKYTLAITEFTKAIQLHPRFWKAYINRGFVYFNQRKYGLAIADYSAAIRINPGDSDAYNFRGIAYKNQRKYDLAVADYTNAIRINPGNSNAYNNRGNAYSDQRKYGLAIDDYTKTIQIDPRNSIAYHNRGLAYDNQFKYDLAIADYTKVVQLSPNDADAYHHRGRAYTNQAVRLDSSQILRRFEKFDLAIADQTEALQLNPKLVAAYRERGATHNLLLRYDLAIADYTAAIEIDQGFARTYRDRGDVYRSISKYDLAIADYSSAIQLKPFDLYSLYMDRAKLYENLNKYDRSLADYEKVIQLKPDTDVLAHVFAERADLYCKLGKQALAHADEIKVIEIGGTIFQKCGARMAQLKASREFRGKDAILDLGGNPIKGMSSAKLTLIQLSSYQSGYDARHFRETHPRIFEEYIQNGKIRFVLLHLPLVEIHPWAFNAAEATRCAAEHGKFWEMSDMLFANHLRLNSLNPHAEAIGLNVKVFENCLESGRHAAAVRNGMEVARNAGLSATPSFILALTDPQNPRKVKALSTLRGARDFLIFKVWIDEALSSLTTDSENRDDPSNP